MRRSVLERRVETVETAFGPVRRKIAAGYGVRREKYEYEDLARIAKEQGISLDEARKLADFADKQCLSLRREPGAEADGRVPSLHGEPGAEADGRVPSLHDAL